MNRVGYICHKTARSEESARARARQLRQADHRSVHHYQCPAGNWHVGHNGKKAECRGCKREREKLRRARTGLDDMLDDPPRRWTSE